MYEDNRLRAVLPMVLRRRLLWTVATHCGPHVAEGSDILIDQATNSGAVATTLLQKLLALGRPDLMELYFVKSGSPLDIAVANVPGLKILEAEDEQIPYCDLAAAVDWASHKKSLDKKYQGMIARERRRLHEQGNVTLGVMRGEPTSAIDWMLEQKRKWAERTNKRGPWIFSPHFQEFLNKLLVTDPRLLVFVLQLDGAPIAAKCVAVNAGSANGVIAAYDDNYKQFSPGTVLDEMIFEHLFENYRAANGRPLDFDFGPGGERPKLHWSRGNVLAAKNYRIAATNWGLARFRLGQALARA